MDRKRALRALALGAACLAATPAFAATDIAVAAAPAWTGLGMTAGILGLYLAGCPRPAVADARG